MHFPGKINTKPPRNRRSVTRSVRFVQVTRPPGITCALPSGQQPVPWQPYGRKILEKTSEKSWGPIVSRKNPGGVFPLIGLVCRKILQETSVFLPIDRESSCRFSVIKFRDQLKQLDSPNYRGKIVQEKKKRSNPFKSNGLGALSLTKQ